MKAYSSNVFSRALEATRIRPAINKVASPSFSATEIADLSDKINLLPRMESKLELRKLVSRAVEIKGVRCALIVVGTPIYYGFASESL